MENQEHNINKKTFIGYHIIKLAIFAVLAILVLIFKEKLVEHLRPFIGSLIILYGVECLLFEIIFHRKSLLEENKSYLGLIEIIFGIVLITAPASFDHVCIVWAAWSIIRESYEIKEIVCDFKTITPRILSGVESVVVIILSVLLIHNPTEHHALVHMILLVVELILSPLTVLIDELILSYKEKKNKE